MVESTLERADSTALARVLRHRWPLLVLWAAVGGILAFATTFLRPVTYRSEATLLPQERSEVGGGLLGNFLDTSLLQTGSRSFKPFYEEMLRSDRILDPVVRRRWPVGESGPDSLRLDQQWGIELSDIAERDDRVREKLRNEVVSLSVEKRSGVMRLACTVPSSPRLAKAIADHLVKELDALVRETRQRDAREQSLFLEERLATIESSLGRASDRATQFLEQNRRFSDSPQLLREYADLQREVDAQTAMWIELRRQLEVSRVEENKSLAALAVLDPPRLPLRRHGPERTTPAMAGVVLGFVVSLLALAARRRPDARGS